MRCPSVHQCRAALEFLPMYLPKHFTAEGDDQTALLVQLITHHNFACLSVVDDRGELEIAHLPFAVDHTPSGELTLRCHVARANPMWQLADGRRCTVIFTGPHAYVSPRWYREPTTQVPTWNYAIVHAVGAARAVDDVDWLRVLVDELSAHHERGAAAPWSVASAEPDKMERLLLGIVGLELVAPTLTGKLKLSQNRDSADQTGVLRGLAERAAPGDAELVAIMQRVLDREASGTAPGVGSGGPVAV